MLNGAQNDNQKRILKPSPQGGRLSVSAEKQKALRELLSSFKDQGNVPFLPQPKEKKSAEQKISLQKGSAEAVPLEGSVSLPVGTLHEIWGARPEDHTAATALILASLRESDAPFLWITSQLFAQEYGVPYGPGLKAAGIDPARLLLVQCRCQQQVLWTLEEGLKTTALAAVVGEIGPVGLKASRRLVLAAREHDTKALLLMRSESMPSTAAYSRWQVMPVSSERNLFDPKAPGVALLKNKLVKHRGGQPPTQQMVEYPHATDHLPVVPLVANRPAVSTGEQKGKRQAAG